MGSNTIIGLIIALVVAAGGYVFFTTQDSGVHSDAMATDATKEMAESDTMMDEEMDEEIDGMTKSADTVTKEDSMMHEVGEYLPYSEDKLAMAEEGDVVLSFYASWCPSCRALESDIQENLENIPSDVTILEVNYDTETDLKKKYGITQQHTFVQVDAAGNELAQWSGSRTLEELLADMQ